MPGGLDKYNDEHYEYERVQNDWDEYILINKNTVNSELWMSAVWMGSNRWMNTMNIECMDECRVDGMTLDWRKYKYCFNFRIFLMWTLIVVNQNFKEIRINTCTYAKTKKVSIFHTFLF